jgi:hypothetical protein
VIAIRVSNQSEKEMLVASDEEKFFTATTATPRFWSGSRQSKETNLKS